jgi:hypothetical protein
MKSAGTFMKWVEGGCGERGAGSDGGYGGGKEGFVECCWCEGRGVVRGEVEEDEERGDERDWTKNRRVIGYALVVADRKIKDTERRLRKGKIKLLDHTAAVFWQLNDLSAGYCRWNNIT